MTRVIWKYKLEAIPGLQTLQVPQGAEVLSVVNQQDEITLYMLVNPDVEIPKVPRQFKVHGTGFQFEEDGDAFLGTFITANFMYVWHVFEVF